MKFTVSHYDNIDEVSERIDDFLNLHPVVNFEAIGILEGLRENSSQSEGDLECIAVFRNEQIQVVTCRIRPYNLLISQAMDIKSTDTLAEYFQKTDISFPGIYGPAEEVKNFSSKWTDLSGEDFKSSDEFYQYSLSTIRKESKLIGEISIAKLKHRNLLKKWTEMSIREIIPKSTDEFIQSCTNSFYKLLESNKVFILEINNTPVSMAAASGQTRQMQAINDVYTPPEYRGKGYATELCLFLSNYILKDCKNTPILWVKTTNYPAIHVYEKIGYEKIAEMVLNLK